MPNAAHDLAPPFVHSNDSPGYKSPVPSVRRGVRATEHPPPSVLFTVETPWTKREVFNRTPPRCRTRWESRHPESKSSLRRCPQHKATRTHCSILIRLRAPLVQLIRMISTRYLIYPLRTCSFARCTASPVLGRGILLRHSQQPL
jgi:hypothetical protein